MAQDAPPPNAFKGLVPGEATIDTITAKLGANRLETREMTDLRYPADGKPDLNDRFYFRNGKLALVTAASPDERYPNRAAIVEKLGEPEVEHRFQTQEYLEYTEKGLRFTCTADGTTNGILYFEPHPRRVPQDYTATRIDLRRDPIPAGTSSPPGDFRVGTATVRINPERFDNLTAAGEKPLKLAEDLFVRVVVFEQGGRRVVFAGADVFGMGSWDVDQILKSLAEKGFEDVVFAMSHTHANVDTIGFYGYYPREYAEHIVAQTEKAVLAAAQDMRPVKELRIGTSEMPLDGGRVCDLIRNGRDPGIIDPTVSIVQAVGTDGKPIANLVHLACHPEVIRLEDTAGLSPDFVGTLCRNVSMKLGGQTVFLNGALGGMVTPDTRFRTQEAASEMGAKLAEVVLDAAKAAQPSQRYDVWRYRRPVEMPLTGESIVAFAKNSPEPLDIFQGRVRTEMSVVWIGDAQFIAVPGELLPEIGFEITERMPGRVRAIIGLANDELGYLVPSYDFREGGYEERTGPGAAGGEVVRSIGLELAPLTPPSAK